MTRYKLDNLSFTTDPLNKRYSRQPIGTSGVGETIYSPFLQLEMTFGLLEVDTDVAFFEGRFFSGGLHELVAPHPKTGVLCNFTGTNIQDFSYEFMDIDSDGYASPGARLIVNHINLGATGTP